MRPAFQTAEEARYAAYARWCAQLGIRPAEINLWRSTLRMIGNWKP